MKKKLILFFLVATLIVQAKRLNIYACGVVRGAFVSTLAQEFHKRFNIDVVINKQGGDRSVIKALNHNKADLGFACRPLLKTQAEQKLKDQRIAWGVLAFLVNPQNPLSSITTKQAKAILKGEITNWKELGGRDAPINLYLRRPGLFSGVGYSLRKIVFHNLQVKLKKSNYIVANSDAVRRAVLKDPNAFAVGDGTSAQADGKVKLLRVDGILPTKQALQSKSYKAARPYYMFMPQSMTPEAQKFVTFALSEEGQKIIAKTHAGSLSEKERQQKLLSESAGMNNFNTSNTVTMDTLLKQNKNKQLTVFACGITRVAFAQEIIKDFSKKYGVDIKTNKSGGVVFALDKVSKKDADVAFVCRKPFKSGANKKLSCMQVAWGALGFIVNPANKITELSNQQIRQVIDGKITNWKELGGDDAPINLYLREGDKSGVGSTLRSILFKDKHYKLTHFKALAKNSGEIRKAVAADPFAIGVDDVTSSQRVKSVKILNINGVKPSKRAIIEKDYKFRRPFYACMQERAENSSKQFVNYVLSEQGQKVISKAKTANLAEAKDLDSQHNLILQQLKLRMQGHK